MQRAGLAMLFVECYAGHVALLGTMIGAVLHKGAKEMFETQVDWWIESYIRTHRSAMPRIV
jgi:hypothetical protein